MNFISPEFLLLLPVVLLFYWRIPAKGRWLLLLFVSCGFYIYWNAWTVCIMLGMTVLTFFLAGAMAKACSRSVQKVWLMITVSLCLLVFFLFRAAGFLPVGISFYTFQMLSYVFDVYRKEILPEKNLGFYALYISFFPQLVAGPIERPKTLLLQLHGLPELCMPGFMPGFCLLLSGFFKKIVVADYLAVFADRVYGAVNEGNGPAVCCATVFFAFQIYCDFSGYSDIARGTAKLFGIELMENFHNPYEAESVRSFWHRWHISLTAWFTDYVYKPLGGSRRGFFCCCRNIIIVFLLSGMWHGMSWTYVIWGGIHGGYLVMELCLHQHTKKKKRKVRCSLPHVMKKILVFFLVCFAWIFFRAATVSDAFILIGNLFSGWNGEGLRSAAQLLGMDINGGVRIAAMLLGLWQLKSISFEKKELSLFLVMFLLMLLIAFGWLSLLSNGGENAFIYFRF